MRGVEVSQTTMLGTDRHLSKRLTCTKRRNQNCAFTRWCYVRMIIAERLAEARMIGRQTNIELGVFCLSRLYPLMLKRRNSTAFVEFLLAFAQQTFRLFAFRFRHLPLRRI